MTREWCPHASHGDLSRTTELMQLTTRGKSVVDKMLTAASHVTAQQLRDALLDIQDPLPPSDWLHTYIHNFRCALRVCILEHMFPMWCAFLTCVSWARQAS